MDHKANRFEEPWITKTWRPSMGWAYISICVFDFILAPILNYAFFFYTKGALIPWKPLTMSDGGLFHMAMGAILGVAAYTRGQEKLKRYPPDSPPTDNS